ncbi:hypothetical protein C1646_768820 [Rhizophagus diaphanus]|nr:hypothetical protein C1646_768820 [Rhizophagus diaphanus] [Rhizophagus sp. MUCL 43196]
MDNDNRNNNNKTSGKYFFDFNNLKRPKTTTTSSRSSTKPTRSTRSSTSMNIKINEQNNLKDTEADYQTISDTSQTETPKMMKIAKLDLFHNRDIDEIIISTNKTTKGSSQAINESSTISFYIPSVVISPPFFSSSFSIKTTISDKAAFGNKAASDTTSAASGDKAVSSGKAASGGKIASGKAAFGGKTKTTSDKAASDKTVSGKAASGGKAMFGKASDKAASSSIMDQAVSSNELAKLIQINQKTALKLNTIINNQERFETMLNEQKDQILNIMSVLNSHRNIETEVKFKKKDHLKEKLENDEVSAKILMKLSEKGVSFNYLWDDRMHSQQIMLKKVTMLEN